MLCYTVKQIVKHKLLLDKNGKTVISEKKARKIFEIIGAKRIYNADLSRWNEAVKILNEPW